LTEPAADHGRRIRELRGIASACVAFPGHASRAAARTSRSRFDTPRRQLRGVNYGLALARGYVTVDVTSACTTLFGHATYFVNGGAGIAKNDNVIWGEST
jgi:hypothetical protein